MGQLIVNMSVTLDGVTQSPGRPDEDTRGGFRHGGWALPYQDQVMAAEAAKGMAGGGAMLFGRRTYEDFRRVWPARAGDGNPFSDFLTRQQKFVVSDTLTEPLGWENSTLVSGDVDRAVRRLKDELAQDLVVLGSVELVRYLTRQGLVDRFALSIHPLILGGGRKLFADDDTFHRLRLTAATPTTTGVIMAVYEPKE